MPLWLATMTMTATWVDGGYLLGTAEGVYRSSVATGLQGGVCFGISLILGGLFFARKMREHAFTTLIDPFEARFGARWAVVLSLPAMLAEMFWSAELLVALGSTFGVVLEHGPQHRDPDVGGGGHALHDGRRHVGGGLHRRVPADARRHRPRGAALPVALDAVGGLGAAWSVYQTARPEAAVFLPPLQATGALWTRQSIVSWWDVSIMLMLGGIPWNCYFQRVLSCRSPREARAAFDPRGPADDRPDRAAAAARASSPLPIRGRRSWPRAWRRSPPMRCR